jgi:hypothetical protein
MRSRPGSTARHLDGSIKPAAGDGADVSADEKLHARTRGAVCRTAPSPPATTHLTWRRVGGRGRGRRHRRRESASAPGLPSRRLAVVGRRGQWSVHRVIAPTSTPGTASHKASARGAFCGRYSNVKTGSWSNFRRTSSAMLCSSASDAAQMEVAERSYVVCCSSSDQKTVPGQ